MAKIINVKVKTNARKNSVKQIEDGFFEVLTTEIPENGKANKSVIELLSDYFKIAKTKFKILKGQKGHLKVVEIEI